MTGLHGYQPGKKERMMSLRASLEQYRHELATSLPAEVLEVLSRNTSLLQERKLAQQALRVGDTFPKFELIDSEGDSHSLTALIAKGPLIVSFYRGGWCPYCVLELKALCDIIDQLPELNTTLVAISPETVEYVAKTKAHNALNLIVLSDEDNRLAKDCGLVFKIPDDLLQQYRNFGISIEAHNGNTAYEIPIPATYVVDKSGVIRYAFVEEDYTSRAEPNKLLSVLLSLDAQRLDD